MPARNQKNQNILNIFLNTYFNVLVSGALILFLTVAYFLFLGPKFRATQVAIQQNIEEQQLLYENQQKKLANLQSVLELYKKISVTDLQRFNSVLPGDYTPERLFGEVEEIIGQGGWILGRMEIDRSSETAIPLSVGREDGPLLFKDKRIASLQLTLEVATIDYPGLKRLLRILENNLRLFDIISVDFSPSSGSATISLTTYYYQAAPTTPISTKSTVSSSSLSPSPTADDDSLNQQ